tara:strand:+ start:308 stop:625 length:318 start_codon:yes stop_codon:yes gene_type:complete
MYLSIINPSTTEGDENDFSSKAQKTSFTERSKISGKANRNDALGHWVNIHIWCRFCVRAFSRHRFGDNLKMSIETLDNYEVAQAVLVAVLIVYGILALIEMGKRK